jgi:isocitrate dehydrogenase
LSDRPSVAEAQELKKERKKQKRKEKKKKEEKKKRVDSIHFNERIADRIVHLLSLLPNPFTFHIRR